MYDSLTYIFPRTLEQAFGPYARLTVEDEPVQLCEADRAVTFVSIVAAVMWAVIFYKWG